MEKISEMIKKLCPEGVERIPLKDVTITQVKGGITKEDLCKNGKYPVINSAREIIGYLDKYNNEEDTIVITSHGAYAGFCHYLSSKFWAGSLCFPLKSVNQGVTKYLYYYIKEKENHIRNNYVNQSGVPYINYSNLGNLCIPFPPLPIQQEIARILDSFTQLQSNLEAELAARQKQYEYYRNKLLTFDKDDESVEWKKVKDFADLKAGKAISASELSDETSDVTPYPCFGGNGLRGYLSYKSHSGEYPIIGRQGALCGCVNWAEGDFYATEHAVVCAGIDRIVPKYMFYLFVHANLNQYKSQGAQPGLSVGKLNELKFALPSVRHQHEIVSILDTFESLIGNLKREIEARKKQYEYYREQLLTF